MWLNRKTQTLYLSKRNVAALQTHGAKNGRPAGYLIKMPKDAEGDYGLMIGGNRDETFFQNEGSDKYLIHLDEVATETLGEGAKYEHPDFMVEVQMDEGHYMGPSGMDKRTYELLVAKEKQRWS